MGVTGALSMGHRDLTKQFALASFNRPMRPVADDFLNDCYV